jgi:uncharacterized protein YndB with AHSA1/START domain
MTTVRAIAERQIGAPAERVYRYIADFGQHHPRFLPPAFSDLRVEQGGVGAGTVISFRLTVGGRTRVYRSEVAEPVPGRVLTETDPVAGSLTTFTVTPEGSQSRVRIETTWQGARGIRGFFERLFAPRVLHHLYREELEHLDRYTQAGWDVTTGAGRAAVR